MSFDKLLPLFLISVNIVQWPNLQRLTKPVNPKMIMSEIEKHRDDIKRYNIENSKDERGINLQSSQSVNSVGFEIVGISKSIIREKKQEILMIDLNPFPDTHAFVKFDDKIVEGQIMNNKSIKCTTPKLRYGKVFVTFSNDKEQWSNPYIIKVEHHMSFGITYIPITIVILVTALYLLSQAV